MNPAKRHHPDPAAAAVMAAMHEHQMAAMFAANAVAGMAAMHTLPGLAQGLSGPGGPGPHLKDEKVEVSGRCGGVDSDGEDRTEPNQIESTSNRPNPTQPNRIDSKNPTQPNPTDRQAKACPRRNMRYIHEYRYEVRGLVGADRFRKRSGIYVRTR